MSYVGIESFTNIMNIMIAECKARKLEFVRIRDISFHDDERLVFTIMTLNSIKTSGVHCSRRLHKRATVEQFLDCVYGSGSTSDLKIIIYDDNYAEDADFESGLNSILSLV